jgi:iron uptake system component EfeO
MRIALVVVSVLALAGCSDDPQSTPVSVTTAANSCDIAPTSAPAGTVVFAVQNTGTQAADFYLYGQADRIVGELEGIGPAEARDLVVEVPAGQYTTACVPGESGEGIRGSFTVETG